MDNSSQHLLFSWLKKMEICFQINEGAITHTIPFLLPLFFSYKKRVFDLLRCHAGKYIMQMLEVVYQPEIVRSYHKQIVQLLLRLFRSLTPDIFK